MKHLPQRTCVVCRTMKDKKDLIRVVCNKNNEVIIDETGKVDGRGAYLCKSASCIESALKRNSLDRQLKTKLPEEVIEELRGKIE